MAARTTVLPNGTAKYNSINPSNSVLLSSTSSASSTLGIIYSLVARDRTILAHYASCHGNFTEVAQQVLKNISRESDRRLSYASGEYMYHYLCEGEVVYLCITDDEFERSKAFLFLTNIKSKFEDAYRGMIKSALPFAMNSEFSDVLKQEMRHYTDTTISLLPSQRLDNIGVRNLELVGDVEMEQLELMESVDSVSLRSMDSLLTDPRVKVRLRVWWQSHWKMVLVAIIVALFCVVVVVAVILGVCLEGADTHCGSHHPKSDFS